MDTTEIGGIPVPGDNQATVVVLLRQKDGSIASNWCRMPSECFTGDRPKRDALAPKAMAALVDALGAAIKNAVKGSDTCACPETH